MVRRRWNGWAVALRVLASVELVEVPGEEGATVGEVIEAFWGGSFSDLAEGSVSTVTLRPEDSRCDWDPDKICTAGGVPGTDGASVEWLCTDFGVSGAIGAHSVPGVMGREKKGGGRCAGLVGGDGAFESNSMREIMSSIVEK